MINVVVSGAAGRMGREIVRLVAASGALQLHGAVDRAPERPGAGRLRAGRAAARRRPGGRDAGARRSPGAGVVIDFTHFEASAAHAEACAAAGVPLVIGATGFTPEARARVAAAARRIPVLLSPNMSVGVNVLFELVRQAAAVLGDAYDVEIVELHHKRKKDAPSGTAMKLAEVAAEALGRDAATDLTYARHGMIGERPARADRRPDGARRRHRRRAHRLLLRRGRAARADPPRHRPRAVRARRGPRRRLAPRPARPASTTWPTCSGSGEAAP